MIPSIPAAFGNFLLPIMIGAKDVAFPRLNLAQLLHLPRRRRSGAARGAWSRAASTPAGRSTRPTAPRRRRAVVPGRCSASSSSASRRSSPASTSSSPSTRCAPRASAGCGMPLFVWAIYGTSIIQVLATPVLGALARPRRHRPLARLGPLRPGARRRPGALPAPLLVLLAPGRLHHDPAGDGGDQRGGPDLRAQEPVRRTGRSPTRRSASRSSGSSPGATTCSSPGMSTFDAGAFGVLSMLVGDLLGHQGLHLGGHACYRGSIALQDAAALLLRVPLPLRLRRDDRRRRRHASPRRPLARHLLRRRPLPLHHGRRHADGVPRRAPLLVPEDDRAHVPRAAGASSPPSLVFVGLLRHVLPAVPPRQRGDAAALLQLPGRSSRRSTSSRRVGACVLGAGDAPHARATSSWRSSTANARGPNPWDSRGYEWLDSVAAAEAQLPRDAASSRSARTTTTCRSRTFMCDARHPALGSPTYPLRAPERHFESMEQQAHAARLGMWVFLASEVLLFAGLFALYVTYRRACIRAGVPRGGAPQHDGARARSTPASSS